MVTAIINAVTIFYVLYTFGPKKTSKQICIVLNQVIVQYSSSGLLHPITRLPAMCHNPSIPCTTKLKPKNLGNPKTLIVPKKGHEPWGFLPMTRGPFNSIHLNYLIGLTTSCMILYSLAAKHHESNQCSVHESFFFNPFCSGRQYQLILIGHFTHTI